MKQHYKRFYSFLILLLLSLLFVSCDAFVSLDMSDDITETVVSVTNGKVKLSGSINIDGALPEELFSKPASDNNAKNAMPVISDPVTYKITAEKGTDKVETFTDSSTGTFELILLPGDWTISVEGYFTSDESKNVILKGAYINEATENKITVSGDSGSISPLAIKVSPVISGDGTGDVLLNINLTGSDIHGYRITWYESGVLKELTYDHTTAIDSFVFTMVANDQTYSVNRYKTVGAYPVRFEFYGDEGLKNTILSFTEMINVFNGLQTTKWVKNGTSEFIDADGNFIVTKEKLNLRHKLFVNQTTGVVANPGSFYQPMADLQDAVNYVMTYNDEQPFEIYLTGDYTGGDTIAEGNFSSYIYINNSSNKTLDLSVKSYGSSNYKIDCNNKANRAIYVNATTPESKVKLNLENITLCNSKSTGAGGLYILDNTEVTLSSGVQICDNYCALTGGAIAISGNSNTSAVLNIDGASIFANTSNDPTYGLGGAVYIGNGTVNLKSGTIGGNSTAKKNTGRYGGAFMVDGGILNITGGTISNNTSIYGGAIYVNSNNSVVNISGGEISYNTASDAGGAIAIPNGKVVISGGSIVSNTTAASFGSAVYLMGPSVLESGITTNPTLILKNDAYIAQNNEILVTDNEITLGGNFSKTVVANVWYYAADPVGITVLKNDTGVNSVSSDYSRFTCPYEGYAIDSNGKICSTASGNSIAAKKPSGVTLPSASYTLPTTQKDLTLSTAAELKQLSLWSQTNSLTGYTFTMTDDIDLENDTTFKPIGTSTYPFKANFDGDGYEIKNLKIIGAAGDSNVALFAYCKDAVIENLTVSGTVQSNAYAGGIVSSFDKTVNLDGVDGIVNCVSYVDVSGSLSAGGIVATGTVNVNKCVNFGSVTATTECGGIRGVSSDGNIKNCVNFGSVTATTSNAGGIVGYAESASGDGFDIENCYNAGNVIRPDSSSSSYYGFIYGYIADETSTNNYYLNESRQFKGGGTGIDGETSYCRITYEAFKSKAPFNAWSDSVSFNGSAYPVPVSCKYPKISYTALSTFASANGKSLPDSSWTVIPSSQKDFSISSKQELKQLSIWAGVQNLAGYKFTVTSPIDLEGEEFTPIGTSSKKFAGVFDGGGKLISNISINQSSTKYVGLFSYIDKAVIKNVVLTGSVEGGQYTGSIAGYVGDSSSSISNCVSYADVTCSATNSNYSGGICGENKGIVEKCVYFGTISGQNSYVGGIAGCIENNGAIKRCVNFGTVKALSIDSTYYGGIIGQIFISGTVSDCYNAGTVISSASAHGLVTGVASPGTYLNNYYITDLPTMTGIGNNEADIEGSIKKESLSVIKNSTNPFMTWTESVIYKGESYPVPVKCPIAPSYMAMTPLSSYATLPPSGTYSISSAGDLDKLNDWDSEDGYAGYTFVLTSNMSMDVFRPIGSVVKPFKGTFDGGGNTITGLTINSPGDNVGLFSTIGDGAKICNLTVEGSVNGGMSTGGICGQNNGGTISNCMFIGTVEGTEEVGGICGKNIVGSEIKNCVNQGSVTSTVSNAAGITGINGGTVSDCANFGVIASVQMVGGISANSTGGTIKNCFSTGTVTKSNADVYTMGMIAGVSYSTITNCYYLSDAADYGCGGDSKDASTATGLKPDVAGKYERIGTYNLTQLQAKLGDQWTDTISIGGVIYPVPLQ